MKNIQSVPKIKFKFGIRIKNLELNSAVIKPPFD